MREYIKIVGLSLIPTALVFIGKSDGFFTFLKEHNFISSNADIAKLQFYSFFVGIFWAGLILPIQFAHTKNKLEQINKTLEDLLSFNKDIYFKSIKDNIKKHNKTFKTRIFVPERGFKALFNKWYNKKLVFTLKEIKGISDPIHAGKLNFEITPKCEGLVGKTCNDKAIIVDCSVEPRNYNLTHYQISKTNDVKFCTTAPIFNESNSVVAVVAIDSNDEIQLSEDETKLWTNQIVYYCAFVDKHIKF